LVILVTHESGLVGWAVKLIPAAIVFANSISKPFYAAYRDHQMAPVQVRPSLFGEHPVRIKQEPSRAQHGAALNQLVKDRPRPWGIGDDMRGSGHIFMRQERRIMVRVR
jgi:hypothetical protein